MLSEIGDALHGYTGASTFNLRQPLLNNKTLIKLGAYSPTHLPHLFPQLSFIYPNTNVKVTHNQYAPIKQGPAMKAIWNNTTIAESDATVVVEGNHYFPLSSLHQQFFQASTHTSTCGWKGLANYYTINVDGKENENAAWVYKTPKEAASEIEGYVAFWQGVTVTE